MEKLIMVDIKNFILKSVSVVMLALFLGLLSSFLLLATVTEDFTKIKKEVAKQAAALLQKQLEQNGAADLNIQELGKACENKDLLGKESADGLSLEYICQKFASGEIGSKEDAIRLFSQNAATQGIDVLTAGLSIELVKLKALGFYALIGAVISILASFATAYLVTMKIGKGVETFSYYSFILAFFGLIFWIAIYFFAPAVVNRLSDLLVEKLEGQTEEFGPIIEEVLGSVLNQIKEVLLRPIYLHLGMVVLGLIAWKTRFGLKTD